MAYKYREEIVGKRFLSVSGFTKLKLGKITEWGWRSGVIRAASHKDNKNKDLQVLVEYDDVEWHRREWISIYKDSLFHFFLVEQALVWCDRRDPYTATHQTVQWPALTFVALVSSVDLSSQAQPVEFLLDRELAFKDYSRLQPFQEWDAGLPGVRDYPELRAEVRRWAELQDGQRILLTTPSVLVGYRVEVYRAEGTTQWYTAVIVGYNEATRDLTVTDDTVLEEHNEDPSLVQMRLIGDGVVESIMRGENVGITPRRSRSALLHSAHHQHHHTLPSSRTSRGVTHSLPTSVARSQGGSPATSVAHRKQRATRPSTAAATATATDPRSPTPPQQNTSTPPLVSQHQRDKDTSPERESITKGGKTQRKRKSSENDAHTITKPRQNNNSAYSNKEDLENKQGRKRNSYTRGAKKKVLEEANNSKLRHVQVRVEDCLHNGETLSNLCRQKRNESEDQKLKQQQQQKQEEEEVVEVINEEPEIKEEEKLEERDEISVEDSNSRLETIQVSGEESNSRLDVPVIEDSNSSSVQLLEEVIVNRSKSIEECREKEAIEAISEEDDCVIVAEERRPSPVVIKQESQLIDCSGVTTRTVVKQQESGSGVTNNSEASVRTEESVAERVNSGIRTEGSGNRISGSVVVDGGVGEVSLPGEEDVTSGGVLLSGCDDDVPLSSSSPLFSRMELSDSSGPASLLRFSDDRSDSGVSSLRSGSCASGDERSGSRSSALSSSDEPPQQQQQTTQHTTVPLTTISLTSSSSSATVAAAVISSAATAISVSQSTRRSPLFVPASSAAAATEAVRVWRDPSLLLENEPHVRHIHSVQHQSLLMSHPAAAPAASAPPSTSTPTSSLATAAAAVAHYPNIPPVPLLGGVGPLHHHPHAVPPPPHHLAPPGLYPPVADMLWKPRYPLSVAPGHLLAPQASHPTAEEFYERDRAYAQDRLRERELEKAQHKKREEERERMERERGRQEREKIEREREKQERERQDRIEREQERERQDKQTAELAVHKHFEESLRLAQQKQFVDSLQRDRNHHPWSLISLPPPSQRPHAAEEDRKRVEQEHQQREHRRQLAANEFMRQEARERERAYHAMTNQRSSSVSSKQEYPPPAHSRVSSASIKVNDKLSVGHTSLPKAEPNMSLFGGYPGYQPGFIPHDSKVVKMDHHKGPSQTNSGLIVNKSSAMIDRERERELVLTNPPPLISEMKSSSSVIVKHEVKSPHYLEPSKVSVTHSPSPKLRTGEMMSHYIPTSSAQQHKTTLYEYRSPTQSPHHLQHPHTPSPHHHMEPQNLGKSQSHTSAPHHHRSSQLPSPHQMHQRQSPHMHQSNSAHQAQAEAVRYSSRSAAEVYQQQQQQQQHANVKSSAASQYAYHTSAANIGSSHYALPVGSSTSSGSKPKVSSPAPPHIYGKPNAGIGSGIPIQRVQESAQSNAPIPLTSKPLLPSSVSPSPYQQVSQYHPPHPHQMQAQSCPPPPPAHSSRSSLESSRALYERNLYSGGAVPGGLTPKPLIHHGTSPPTATAAPSPISRSPHLPHNLPQMPLSMHHSSVSPAVQTQPLDLGVSDRSTNREEHVTSPKRKGTPLNHPQAGPIPLEVKKRKLDSPGGVQMQQQPPPQQPSPQPLSLHVSGSSMQPQLARVSEPSPLIASAATTITTVVNTAAYRTPANTIIISQPHHLSESQQEVSVTQVTSVPSSVTVAQTDSAKLTISTVPSTTNSVTTVSQSNPVTNSNPVVSSSAPVVSTPSTVVSEAPTTPIKVNLTPSVVDSEKSNSPGPIKSSTNYPVRHLKKAWLQRHTGEDVEDTTGVTGSGSCVTLPIPNVNNSSNQTKEISTPVTSLHSIGTMAINSINKTKSLTPKGNVRKGQTKDSTLNGHGTDSTKGGDDSSSSDQERGRKSPPKRKPPKVKRKKGGGTIKKTPSEDLKKRKVTTSQSVAASESGSDSDKESGSEKDSDSGASTQTTTSGKKTANGGNAANQKDKEPRKRGRRPKSSKNDKGEEPRQKKSREEREPSLPQRDPFRKPPVGQLKKTGESFLQDGPCFEVAPKLAKCRECRWTPNQRSKNMPNIFCRFYAFRRLRYTKNGQLAIAGFSDPHKDASEEDLKLWLPLSDSPPPDLDLEMSRLLLHQVGDHFCDLLVQERDALAEHMSDDKTIAWKRVVQGVREMCDVCETTLFNFHWACGKCGFVVCLDCYKGRKNGTIKIWGEAGKDRDEFSWLQCTNRQPHEQEKLMLTQIIAGDSLLKLGKRTHEFRELWGIPQFCACPLSKESKSINGAAYKDIIKGLIKGELNGVKTEKKEEDDDKKPSVNGVKEDKKSPLSWLADVALSNEDSKNKDDCSSDSDGEKDGNFSTLRELLIRPSHKSNGSRAASPANTISNPNNNGLPKSNKKTRMETLDEVISSVIEDTVHKDDVLNDVKSVELKHFVRRYNWQTKGREPLPIRIMTLTESKILYPNIPHSWLCDGKLLRLTDPAHAGNYRIFQDQWKRGQPVIVSDVAKSLDMNLWHPDSFIRDFGDEKNDLINCMTGKLVPNQPMSKFWEGFEHFSKRLKDERGNPMLLKLKDWPPGEDFAELMPSRFNDLMRVLPLSEYTHRTGRLNLASRLPECFVRPDLGPKMYNAYGSALHPTKGTTNLHLDISDAVNVMVYVGIPKDGDNDEHIKEAFRAIDEAGCDILTRRRVRDKGELPGALWHIYNARDADKIRDLLNKVALEKGERLEPHHDPIHDQSGYLDGPLRERLYKEYGVEGYAIVQCLGDAVFIPAGAPHQVRNLHNCIKVAEDFVSPENVSHCFHLTQEFRELSDTHTNHEDKLQIKNIIYHTVKDSLSVLSSLLKNHTVKNETDDSLLDGCIKTEKDLSGSSSDSNSPSGSPANDDTDSKEAA